MAEPSSGTRQNGAAAETVLRHKITSDYVKMSNAVARDHRLSYRARGVLLEMVSRPPNWKFSAERLALASPTEGRDAIRTALRELEALGYLSRERERGPNGRVRTVVTVSDKPIPEWRESAARFPAVALPDAPPWESETFSQFAPETGQPTSGEPSSKERRGYEEHIDMTCVRLASLAADAPHGDDETDETGFDPTWREQDRELFAAILEASTVETDGRKWMAGRYTVDGLYNGMRKASRKAWPGRYVARIAEDDGVSDWLIDEGITVID